MNDALNWPAPAQAALAARHQAESTAGRQRSARQTLRLLLLRSLAPVSRWTTPAPPTAPPQRVLLIRPDHLGDLLFTTPALQRLRQVWPNAHITALVGPWGQPILADHPALDEILTLPFPGFTRQPATSPWAPYRLLAAEADRLRAGHFDLALILRFDHWWGAWLAQRAHIPRRFGFAVPECAPFLTTAVPYNPRRHEVEQNLALVAAASGQPEITPGPLHFSVPPAAAAWAAAWLAGRSLADRPLVALLPGAGAAVKLWRAESWAALAAALQARGLTPLLAGGAGEVALAQAINACLPEPLPSAVGETSLAQLAALLQRSALVIGLDSGPMHLAAALGVPTIHLYGPVSAASFGPWGDPARHRVITSAWACVPCNRLDFTDADLPLHPCVRAITVEQVLAALPAAVS
ncbi:glycosyltransferase family 9 protein [Candidatus Amarolinea dominans]|uniref:glycosyltransferase family 9 protein n=1 Tax=Candidatus Amarolinea dominans TaxID=3140696 RepID=UPI0031365E3D|nr:glycosyltransferase family 9 protein [Anaerolineae bacterium]